MSDEEDVPETRLQIREEARSLRPEGDLIARACPTCRRIEDVQQMTDELGSVRYRCIGCQEWLTGVGEDDTGYGEHDA